MKTNWLLLHSWLFHLSELRKADYLAALSHVWISPQEPQRSMYKSNNAYIYMQIEKFSQCLLFTHFLNILYPYFWMNKLRQSETEQTEDRTACQKMLFVQQSILWLGSKFQVLMCSEPLVRLRSHARMSSIDQECLGGVMRLQFRTKSHAGTILSNIRTWHPKETQDFSSIQPVLVSYTPFGYISLHVFLVLFS